MKNRAGAFPRTPLSGDYWAAASYLLVGLLAVFIFATAIPPDPSEPPPPSHDAAVRNLVKQETLSLQRWQVALAELCRDPAILALGLQPNCASGSIELQSDDYFRKRTNELTEEGKEKLRQLVPRLLARLKSREDVWRWLFAIEIRGHADPQAMSDRYATNLVTSQGRALAVLLFLTSDEGIPEEDRNDLQKLAIASGAADSRLPAECLQRTRECYERARRVEIRLDVDDTALRTRLGRFYNRVHQLVRQAE